MDSDFLQNILNKIEESIVSQLLPKEAIDQYHSGNIAQVHLKKYIKSIGNLSAQYLKKENISPGCSELDAEAYALYYLPINAAKILNTLQYIPKTDDRLLRVLDYGCGPGTASLAFHSLFPKKHRIDLIDHDPSMLACAKNLTSAFVETYGATLTDENKDYDFIFLSNVLSENEASKSSKLIQSLVNKLSHKGYIILLEPGSLKITRQLMQLRDSLLHSDQTLSVIFPCPHRLACPMLKLNDQWCHGTLKWTKPKLIDQFDELLGFNKHRIKFSCIIFQKEGSNSSGYRLIQDPSRSKRGTTLSLCGDGELKTITVPKRKANLLRGLKSWDIVGNEVLQDD